ncbi:MAG: hypothetical protein U1A62_28345 [Pseudomonas sp.]|nr:hypothetical protein [Pseudomonas sp.]
MEKNYFDPHTSFIRLPIFKSTITISITLATVACAIIITNSELTPNFSFEGFNQALTVFKLPLGILAVTIPIIALLAANHKSEQTREQMRLASENNNFSNYFKHFSEFQSYIEKNTNDKDILKVKNLRNMHIRIFPQSKIGIFDSSPKAKIQINEFIEKYLTLLQTLSERQDQVKSIKDHESFKPEDIEEFLPSLMEAHTNICKEINEFIPSQGLWQNDETAPRLHPLNSNSAPIMRLMAVKNSVRIISLALSFDEKYEASILEQLLDRLEPNAKEGAGNLSEERVFLDRAKEIIEI